MRYKVYDNTKGGFTLIEVATALIILALISFNVLVVVDNCVVSASNSKMKMQAFQVARENMEQLMDECHFQADVILDQHILRDDNSIRPGIGRSPLFKSRCFDEQYLLRVM